MSRTAPMLIAALLLATPFASWGQADLPATLRVIPAWQPGERHTYVVQQVVKERAGEREATRFLANGTLEIEVVEATPAAVTFTWHRRMDNGEMELVREPWGVRGNAPYERLLASTIKDGLPLTVKLDLGTHRLRIENRDELVAALSRRLQSVGGEADLAVRRRAASPAERNSREPSNAALGIHQPLVRHEATKYAATPRSGKAVSAWYARLTAAEIEDFLGFLGRDLQRDGTAAPGAAAVRSYRPAGENLVMVTLSSAPVAPPPVAEAEASEDGDASPKAVGLAGGDPLPVAHEAKIEVTLPSGWPKRAAIVHAEDGGAQRTTLRRVYLHQ